MSLHLKFDRYANDLLKSLHANIWRIFCIGALSTAVSTTVLMPSLSWAQGSKTSGGGKSQAPQADICQRSLLPIESDAPSIESEVLAETHELVELVLSSPADNLLYQHPVAALGTAQRYYMMAMSEGVYLPSASSVLAQPRIPAFERIIKGRNIHGLGAQGLEIVRFLENAGRRDASGFKLPVFVGPPGTGKSAFFSQLQNLAEELTTNNKLFYDYTYEWKADRVAKIPSVRAILNIEPSVDGTEYIHPQFAAMRDSPIVLLPEVYQKSVLQMVAPFVQQKIGQKPLPHLQLNPLDQWIREQVLSHEKRLQGKRTFTASEELAVLNQYIDVRRIVEKPESGALIQAQPGDIQWTNLVYQDNIFIKSVLPNHPAAYHYTGALLRGHRRVIMWDELFRNNPKLLSFVLAFIQDHAITYGGGPLISIDTLILGNTNTESVRTVRALAGDNVQSAQVDRILRINLRAPIVPGEVARSILGEPARGFENIMIKKFAEPVAAESSVPLDSYMAAQAPEAFDIGVNDFRRMGMSPGENQQTGQKVSSNSDHLNGLGKNGDVSGEMRVANIHDLFPPDLDLSSPMAFPDQRGMGVYFPRNEFLPNGDVVTRYVHASPHVLKLMAVIVAASRMNFDQAEARKHAQQVSTIDHAIFYDPPTRLKWLMGEYRNVTEGEVSDLQYLSQLLAEGESGITTRDAANTWLNLAISEAATPRSGYCLTPQILKSTLSRFLASEKIQFPNAQTRAWWMTLAEMLTNSILLPELEKDFAIAMSTGEREIQMHAQQILLEIRALQKDPSKRTYVQEGIERAIDIRRLDEVKRFYRKLTGKDFDVNEFNTQELELIQTQGVIPGAPAQYIRHPEFRQAVATYLAEKEADLVPPQALLAYGESGVGDSQLADRFHNLKEGLKARGYCPHCMKSMFSLIAVEKLRKENMHNNN